MTSRQLDLLRNLAWHEWGEWHSGEAVDIRVGPVLRHRSPYTQDVAIEVRDKLTNTIHYRRGDCRAIGNFSPIWITWKGRPWEMEFLLKKSVPELLLIDIL